MANDKLKSRKFIVWLTSTIFVVVSLILNFISDSFMEVSKIFAESRGWVSAVYIGGNVTQKFVNKNSTSEEVCEWNI